MFKDRQEQIEEKLEEVQREREESLRQREQLIEEMEIANQLTQRDLERAEEQKEALKLDLKGQVSHVYSVSDSGCLTSVVIVGFLLIPPGTLYN